jgi:tetratricopeptide (TPR) repeat protein
MNAGVVNLGFVLVIFALVVWFKIRDYRSNPRAKRYTATASSGTETETDSEAIRRPAKIPRIWIVVALLALAVGLLNRIGYLKPVFVIFAGLFILVFLVWPTIMKLVHTKRLHKKHPGVFKNRPKRSLGFFSQRVKLPYSYYPPGSFLPRVMHFSGIGRPYGVDDYLLRGDTHCSGGKYEEAITDYTQAILLEPTLAVAYENRGFAYSKLADNKRATEDYKIAAEFGLETAKDWLRSHLDDAHGGFDGSIPLFPKEKEDLFRSWGPIIWSHRFTTITKHIEMGGGTEKRHIEHIEGQGMDRLILTNQRLLIIAIRKVKEGDVFREQEYIKYAYDLSNDRIKEWIATERQMNINRVNAIRQTWRTKGLLGIIKGDFVSDDDIHETPLEPADKRSAISTPLFPIIDIYTKWHPPKRKERGWTGIRLVVVCLHCGIPKSVSNFSGVIQKLSHKRRWLFDIREFDEIQLCKEEHTQKMLERLGPIVAEVAKVLKTRSNWRGV